MSRRHDRGARVTHRMLVDHADTVERATLLDIAPTLAMYEQTTMEFARAYFHWFFLIQREPLPETMIEANPEFFIEKMMGNRHAGLGIRPRGARRVPPLHPGCRASRTQSARTIVLLPRLISTMTARRSRGGAQGNAAAAGALGCQRRH